MFDEFENSMIIAWPPLAMLNMRRVSSGVEGIIIGGVDSPRLDRHTVVEVVTVD